MAVVTQIQNRRDTAANWTSANPTLGAGELGFETDTLKFKIGNGSSTWSALNYSNPGIYQSTPTFTTNAYTLLASDSGNYLLASNSTTAGTISIPTNATTAFPIGTQITIQQTGTGQLTIQAATSGTTTVTSTGATAISPKLRVQYSTATCIKTATDSWTVIGDIA
jgi:hypothetical protein